jgi:methionine sulfoxide reductase heme-binding subunit
VKPVVFAACAAPAALMTLGILAAVGKLSSSPMDLGADPVDHLLRLRRMLGLFAFFYALAHFTVYAWLDQGLDLRAIGADIIKRPYITIGMLALLLLVPLAITSTNRMMRRLGRGWQKLHRLVYLITLLGVWHFWWQVKKDIREPLLYIAIFAVLMAWRLFKAKSVPATAPGRT